MSTDPFNQSLRKIQKRWPMWQTTLCKQMTKTKHYTKKVLIKTALSLINPLHPFHEHNQIRAIHHPPPPLSGNRLCLLTTRYTLNMAEQTSTPFPVLLSMWALLAAPYCTQETSCSSMWLKHIGNECMLWPPGDLMWNTHTGLSLNSLETTQPPQQHAWSLTSLTCIVSCNLKNPNILI